MGYKARALPQIIDQDVFSSPSPGSVVATLFACEILAANQVKSSVIHRSQRSSCVLTALETGQRAGNQ